MIPNRAVPFRKRQPLLNSCVQPQIAMLKDEADLEHGARTQLPRLERRTGAIYVLPNRDTPVIESHSNFPAASCRLKQPRQNAAQSGMQERWRVRPVHHIESAVNAVASEDSPRNDIAAQPGAAADTMTWRR